MAQQKGFFVRLFDFSFSEFITIRIVGIIYAGIIVLMTLSGLSAINSAFSYGFSSGINALIFGPLFVFLFIILIRVWLESLVASIRTSENTRIIAENTRPTNS